MNVDVYDTYVRTVEGDLLHFDVLLPAGDGIRARQYAYQWLRSIGRNPQETTLEKCHYCHSESSDPETQLQIDQYGYFIIPIEGCPDSRD